MHLARDMNNCDTNLHEPCNGYTEFDMFYYLAITIFEICPIIKVSEDYRPCHAPEIFYCRYKKSYFLYLVYPNNLIQQNVLLKIMLLAIIDNKHCSVDLVLFCGP